MPLIVFEGMESCGKTTQIRLLAERLMKEGRACSVVREPGGTPVGESIRTMILHGTDPMFDSTRALLFMAARSQSYATMIRPRLQRNEVVLLDRCWVSTYCYQHELELTEVEYLAQFACGKDYWIPDLAMVFEIGLDEMWSRMARDLSSVGRGADRFERESAEYHGRVRDRYSNLRKYDWIEHLDGTWNQEDLSEAVFEKVGERNL